MSAAVAITLYAAHHVGDYSPHDAPQLATGGWALDQAWHIFWGVFVAALLAVTL